MADINKADIKLMESQRLDDTAQGGGQMTSHEVVDGAVNNLFPDISRLDRVYGRVSLRKAYLAVQTAARETYYGSHTILTEQAKDSNVSMCFFSNQDWFNTRDDARDRIEAYLVKGPHANIKFWGDHYAGTSFLKFVTNPGWDVPQVGDVLVVIASLSNDHEQYVRVTDVSQSTVEFISGGSGSTNVYYKIVIDIEIGTQLAKDISGTEVFYRWDDMVSDDCYTTIAADASRYYGIATLQEEATAGQLLIRVDDIQTHLVPSAASETAVTDAGVGSAVATMLQTQDPQVTVDRSIQFNIAPNAKLHIGEGVLPGTFSWTGGLAINDGLGQGDIYNGSDIVGSIDYVTGIITFGQPGVTTSGTGIATYVPACAPQQISQTGGIIIDTNNRGFVYTFSCNPLPKEGTLKVEYLAGGKWYSIWDIGNGQLKNTLDGSIGAGSVNFITGSVSVTFGSMPDVDSKVLFLWAKNAEYYDFSGETLPLRYNYMTNDTGVARNTFSMVWSGDSNGPGPAGEYGIVDDGNAGLVVGAFIDLFLPSTVYGANDQVRPTIADGYIYRVTVGGTSGVEPVWPAIIGQTVDSGTVTFICEAANWEDWVPEAGPIYVGTIKYATGEVDTAISATQFSPLANDVFQIDYKYGPPFEDNFFAPPRDGQGHITVTLNNTPIVPGTFRIEWHNDLEEYDPETRFDITRDPTYIFKDDGAGNFDGDTNDGTPNWIQGTVDYVTGEVTFHPDRTSVFPHVIYKWIITTWVHPGVEESRVFDRIMYLQAGSFFPTDGTVYTSYCTTDGTNAASYSGTMSPIYYVKETSGLELVPGSLSINADGTYLIDGNNGKLYTHSDGVNGDVTQVGTIHYINKTFSITSDAINLQFMIVSSAIGTAAIEPVMSMVFRAPGAPLRPGSSFFRATTGAGTLIEGTTDFAGEVSGTGIFGHVDFSTGLCHVAFGEWVPDDAWAQAQEWYSATANDGMGNVWKPYQVAASTILMNCVITSYLPLDPDLLGLDPVRLPLDGKVPIFRDGYIIVVFNSRNEDCPHPLTANYDINKYILEDVLVILPRQNLDLIEVYSEPTAKQIEDGTQTCAIYIADGGNYEVDLVTGTVNFLTGFQLPFDSDDTLNQLVVLHRIEDMCLASDVQVTGHIAITSPLLHDYPVTETKVSSVLPSADLQSRAYNEFEQESWSTWADFRDPAIPAPLASYNFVDYPISVTNQPSIKERWLLKFTTSRKLDVIGENFGVLAENVDLDDTNPGSTKLIEFPPSSTIWYVGIENRQFPGQYYFLMRVDGFGLGWASGNCIRFNQDAANYPLWFIRTTLQAPPEEAVDYYTIQLRGDSS